MEALCQLREPDSGWQVIAVDNGSTDSTRSILDSFTDRLPLVVLTEGKKGKNNALNKAIDYVEGDLVVFTDDDVVPAQDWLIRFLACADRNANFDIFGGQILPRWPYTPPQWLFDELPLGMLFAITDPQLNAGEIDVGNVWGPNMAIRKSVFDLGVRYSTDVGPDGSQTYMMGSEGDFTRRLGSMGMKAWFCKEAIVEHLIRPNQISKEWVLNRFFRHGRSSYKFDHRPDAQIPRVFGIERWLYRRLFEELGHYVYCCAIGNSSGAFKAMAAYHHMRGRIHQAKLEIKPRQ